MLFKSRQQLLEATWSLTNYTNTCVCLFGVSGIIACSILLCVFAAIYYTICDIGLDLFRLCSQEQWRRITLVCTVT